MGGQWFGHFDFGQLPEIRIGEQLGQRIAIGSTAVARDNCNRRGRGATLRMIINYPLA